MKLSRAFLYPTMVPTDILGFLVVVVFCWSLWGATISTENGCVIVEGKENCWLKRHYRNMGAFTMGHFIWIQPGEDRKRMLTHEFVHVKQNETHGLASAVMSAPLAFFHPLGPVVGLCTWALGPFLVYAAAWMTALCYGQNIYYGNIEEEAAYDHAKAHEE